MSAPDGLLAVSIRGDGGDILPMPHLPLPLPLPHLPPAASSTTAAVALAALREIVVVSFDRRATDLARRALCAVGECNGH
jgi:hypothetical protein